MVIATEDTYLEVPYAEKDKVKSLKARWDRSVNKWYAPKGADLDNFSDWIIAPTDGPATLSAIISKMSIAIAKAIPAPEWCSAEIAEINTSGSNGYFSLVEMDGNGGVAAKVRATAFGAQFAAIRKKFIDGVGTDLTVGMKVLLLVKPMLTPKYGMTLMIEGIDPNYTLGGVAAQLKALLDRLASEDLYKTNKSLTMPRDFTHVAIISPKEAAGLGDFWRDVSPLQDAELCKFSAFTALFQGDSAKDDICQAIERASVLHETDPLDAIVIIRGGGAATDLAWLNQYDIAKAVALSPVKVFSGIGHERDDTAVDLVAGVRFGTPSKVSAFIMQTIIQNAGKAIEDMGQLNRSANNLIKTATDNAKHTRDNLLNAADNKAKQITSTLNSLRDTLVFRADKACSSAITELRVNLTTLMTIDPSKMLGRGYAIVRQDNHHAPTKASLSGTGVIEIEFEDGKLEARYDN